MCSSKSTSLLLALAVLGEGLVGGFAVRQEEKYGQTINVGQLSFLEGEALVPCGDLERMYGIKIGLQIGNYSLVRCLGGGSFGEVWEVLGREAVGSVKAAMKISKTRFGERDFRGQDQAENSLKECLYAQKMKKRDTKHFADCYEIGTFLIDDGSLLYSVIELADGRDLQSALFGTQDAVAELPTLADVTVAALQLYDACDATVQSGDDNLKFFHNDLQPSNILVDSQEGNVHITVLDYGEATICCDLGIRCDLEDGGLRKKLGLKYGEQLDICSEKAQRGSTIDAQGVEVTTTLLVLNVLLMLSTPQSARSPALGPVFQHERGAEESVVENAVATLRAAYQSESAADDRTKNLLVGVIRAGYRDALSAHEEGTWPPEQFLAALRALREHLSQ